MIELVKNVRWQGHNRFTVILLVSCLIYFSGRHDAAGANCENAISTEEIISCEELEFKNATRDLSELQKELDNVLNPKQQKALEVAHVAWLAYRKAHCASAALPYDPGSMAAIVSITCAADLTKQRVKELRDSFRDVLELLIR